MKRWNSVKREGKIVVLTAVLLPVLFGMAAFAIDIGYIGFSRSRLQAAAEAAALAAVGELPNGAGAITRAQDLGQLNFADVYPNIVATQDVEFGRWEDGAFVSSTASEATAVRVTARLSEENGNSLALFLGKMLGTSQANLAASAIAFKPGGGVGTRFLIDEDMLDKDVPAIENLATSLGRDPEELVTARGFNQGKQYGDTDWTWEDNFLDIPAGSRLSFPTGQGTGYDNNDAGLFDIDNPDFPFTEDLSFQQFLFYSETGGDSSKWGTDASIWSQLDPLYGVEPVTDGSLYDSFVHPDFIHVSPVFPSDISTLNQSGGVPQVNAKGLRRGLLAHKIVSVGADTDGGGSVLPELELEIVDPSTISMDDIEPTGGSSGGGSGSLQIVK